MRRAATRRGMLLLVLLCGGPLAAAQDADVQATDDAPSATPACRGLALRRVPASATTDRVISARDTLDLVFRVQLSGQNTPSQVEMRYFTPAGHLYQSLQVPVAPEGSREQERALPDHPFPVKVARVAGAEVKGDGREGNDRERFVDMPALPVAGTVIAQNSLYGTWRAEAWPAGATTPCTRSFTIRP